MQFLVNHIGHFALLNELSDLVRNVTGRIVIVSSSAAVKQAPPEGIMFDNLDGHEFYKPVLFYGQSKLANGLFAKELSRRLERPRHRGQFAAPRRHPRHRLQPQRRVAGAIRPVGGAAIHEIGAAGRGDPGAVGREPASERHHGRILVELPHRQGQSAARTMPNLRGACGQISEDIVAQHSALPRVRCGTRHRHRPRACARIGAYAPEIPAPAAACARRRAAYRSSTTRRSLRWASSPPNIPFSPRWSAAAAQDRSPCASSPLRWSWIDRPWGTICGRWSGTTWSSSELSADDRRKRHVELTKKGRDILHKSRRLWRQAEGRFEEIFGKQPAAELRAVLLSIAGNKELNSLLDRLGRLRVTPHRCTAIQSE
jgi:hypothetical protein